MTWSAAATFGDLPRQAAWRHQEARDGFEVVFFASSQDGYRITGHTAAVEDGQAWTVSYELHVGADWSTRTAKVRGASAAGERHVTIESAGSGHWLVDGVAAPELAGCYDVDLESSAMTNAFPVRRLRLEIGQAADAPAVYVCAADLRAERLEQRYSRLADEDGRQCYDYSAPAFDFAGWLTYDSCGLVTSYPGLAVRIS